MKRSEAKTGKHPDKKIIILLAALVLILAVPAAAFLLFGRDALPGAHFLAFTLFLLLLSAFLIYRLCRNLREDFYSYTNVVLIGAVIFTAILALNHVFNFVLALVADENISSADILGILLAFPRNFAFFAMPVLIIVCGALCVSNIALIRHEGMCLANILGFLLSAAYIGVTVLLLYGSHMIYTRVIVPAGLNDNAVLTGISAFASIFLLTMLCYAECMLAGVCVMGWKAAKKIPAYDKDYIIILGCSIDKRGGLLPLLKGRANRAVRFAWEQEIATGRPVHYVPSGGQGKNEIMSEGSAMELYLLSHGAEDYEVFPEKQSANTYENLVFSKRIIDSLMPNARVAYATTNYHVFRSGILAAKAGLDAEGIASGTKWYFWPNGFVREFIAIMSMNKKTHIIMTAFSAVVGILYALIG